MRWIVRDWVGGSKMRVFVVGGRKGVGWWVVRPWWVCGWGVGVLIGGFGGFGEELLVH